MRYRWIALGCLVVIGGTGGWMLFRLDRAELLARPGAPVSSSFNACDRPPTRGSPPRPQPGSRHSVGARLSLRS